MPAHVVIVAVARVAGTIAAMLPVVVLGAIPAAAVADGTAAAVPGQYPFAVKLTMTHIALPAGTLYNSACSAALISPTWIITAEHCFHDVNSIPVSGPVPYATTATLFTAAGDRRARPGHWFDLPDLLAPAPTENTVSDVQQAGTSDIALGRLATPVTNVSPLGLSDTTPVTGAVLTLAGWGATTGFIPTPSNQLSTGGVKIQAVNRTTITVLGSSHAADTSACLYDSGAPYFTTPPGAPLLLVATESTGPNYPHTNAETTARVDALTPWIKTIVPEVP